MAPLKTYSKLNDVSKMKHSIYNSIAEPIIVKRKRGRKKIVIPDLPPPPAVCQLSNNSLKVTTEDSFDRLLKTSNYNSIHFKSISSSDSSCDNKHHLLNVKNPRIKITNYKHSAAAQKKVKTVQKNDMTYDVLNKEKSTGTSIETSLEIEVVQKMKPLIDSSLGLTNLSLKIQKSVNNSITLEPVSSRSFQNVPTICSTPIEPEKQNFIDQTISPITINNFADSLVLFRNESNAHEPPETIPSTPKLKIDDNKPVSAKISSSKIKRRISYITVRKRKIYFTPVALLSKRKTLRTRDNSNDLKDMNSNPSNLEHNQEFNTKNSRSHSSHGETEDIIENSYNDDFQLSKENLLQKSILIRGKNETDINPVYITLRNRKISKISKKAHKALNFDNCKISDVTQNINDTTSSSKENQSSSIFSNESSFNSDNSSKADMKATNKIQQTENSICCENTNLERSHNSSCLYIKNIRFEEVSVSVESINTTNTNVNDLWKDTCPSVENAVSTMKCEEKSTVLMPANSDNGTFNDNNTHESLHNLNSIKRKSITTKSPSSQQSASLIYGESICDSIVAKNYELNFSQSKRNCKNNSAVNEASYSEETTDELSENNLENNFSASKETVSQFEGLQNVPGNSETSEMPLPKVNVRIKRSSIVEDMIKKNLNLKDYLKDTGTTIENSLDDVDQRSTTSSASVLELEESSQYSILLNYYANKNTVSQFEELEDVSINSSSTMPPLNSIINITRSDTVEDIIKNNFNLESFNDTDIENNLNDKNQQGSSSKLSASVTVLEDSSECSTSLNSDIISEIKGNKIAETALTKENSNLEEECLISDSFSSLHLNDKNKEELSTVVEVKENSKNVTLINSINLMTKFEPVVKIARSYNEEKLLNLDPAIENQTTERQSEASSPNGPFRGFECGSVQQQSLESTPLCHNISSADSNNHSMESIKDFVFALPHTPTLLKLKPGKPYRRSLLQIKNSSNHFSPINTPFKSSAFSVQERNYCVANTGGICTCATCKKQPLKHLPSRRVSVRFMPISPPTSKKSSTLQNYAAGLCKGYNSDVFQESLLENYFENLSLTRENLEVTLEEPCREPTVTAREIVLRRCGQTEPLPFEKCYPNLLLQHCHKIGEGVYGEVFLFRNQNGGTTVMKVIPIEGDQIINGEKQKKFDEIISEIIIAMELSTLRKGKKNNTTGFNELQKICCVQGKYPERLLELWELYEEGHGTENDSPEIFTEDQLYIVLELANGGKDLEAFVFNNAQQAYATFIQTACAIAVAETALQFEHRDLHWGNMLISNCDRSKMKIRCCIDGEEIEFPTFGVEVAIIDFTLSRITHDGVCIYNDLSLDADLFTAKGDYQFDIYRLMKSSNGNQWQHFQPYTNVLWLHYILDKMITGVRYKNKKTRMHKEYLIKLEFLKQEILEYKSVKDLVNSKFSMASALQ